MASYSNADACSRFQMMRRLVFDGNTRMQNIIHYSLLAPMQDAGDIEVIRGEDLELVWDCTQQRYNFNKKRSKKISYAEFLDSCGLLEYSTYSEDEESDTERKARLLLEEKKNRNKADKKRLKKLRQKEKKRLEKELQKPPENKETKDIVKQDKADDKPCDDKTKECLNLKDMATALDSESSEDTSDGSSEDENEGLDLTSSFVSKAAEIAKRQLEQKQEIKDKKKSPGKEEPKMAEKSTCEESHDEKKDTVTSDPKMEDVVKMSTELAMMGNKLATDGKFELAIKFFTNAIKFNPTEFRLFGNRAFCFEKMQEFDKSLNDAELSLSMCPGWVKGLFRKGRALAGLKRYEEAASAFKEVVKLDSSCTEAAQELVRVQISQLMEYGFTQDQSSKALIIHGSVDKAREFLSKLNKQSELPSAAPVPPQQVVNVTGLSPILAAKMTAAAAPHPAQDTSKSLHESLIPVQSHQTLAKPADESPTSNYVTQAPELFPVWVGNLSYSVTETLLENLFSKVGRVYSMKLLSTKRCAFMNFTQQEHCDAAIRRYHGYELLGSKLAVRYPDRIPPGLNISRSAHKSTDLPDEILNHNAYAAGRTGYAKPFHSYYKGPSKY